MHCLPVEDIFASVHPPTGAEKKATAPATSNTHSDQQQPAATAQHLYPPLVRGVSFGWKGKNQSSPRFFQSLLFSFLVSAFSACK